MKYEPMLLDSEGHLAMLIVCLFIQLMVKCFPYIPWESSAVACGNTYLRPLRGSARWMRIMKSKHFIYRGECGRICVYRSELYSPGKYLFSVFRKRNLENIAGVSRFECGIS